MYKTDSFEMSVEIWYEEDMWNYSLIQGMSHVEENSQAELIAFGTTETAEDAAKCVADELKMYVAQVLL